MADSSADTALNDQTDAPTTSAGLDDADFMRRARNWFRKDRDHIKEWRNQAEEDFAFVAGEQWEERDKRALKEAMRPVITFNRIDPLIRSVSGEQINNAQEVRYLPRELGDAKVSEGLTSVAEWFRDQCDADDEESDAFWDAAVCGVGCTETTVNVDENPDEPMPQIDRIDPLEKYWDADARKRNLSDRKRDWRVRKISREAAIRMFPDAAPSDLDASWARSDDTDTGQVQLDTVVKYQEDQNDPKASDNLDKEVTIVQLQWFEYQSYYRVNDPATGASADLEEEQYLRLSERMAQLGTPLQGVKLQRKKFKQAFIGRTILKMGDPPCGNSFSSNYMTGFRDRNNGTFYGLVRSMKDPQRWANKWLSQTLHIMNTNAKGGVLMEDDGIENKRKFEESYAKPEQITWVPPGTLSGAAGKKIQEKPAATFPQGFYQLMTFAISSVRDVAGVNLEMLGMREADQAASLEYQRRQAGVAILAPLFRSMRRYHRNQGKVLLYYIQTVLNPMQLVKVLGSDGNQQYQPLQTVTAMKGASAKYDIIVDEGPTSPNQKERVWAVATPLFQGLPPAIQLALLEYSPLPSSVVEKIKQAAAQAQQTPQAQMQQQMHQLQAMLIEAKAMLARAQAVEALAKAGVSQNPQTEQGANDPTAMLADLAKAKNETDTQAQVDLTRIASDAAAAREKNVTNLQINREWQSVDQKTALAKAALSEIGKAIPRQIPQHQPHPSTRGPMGGMGG